MREKLQTFGKAMLVPLSLIAIGGLFLGLGGAMTSKMTITSLGINWNDYASSNYFTIFSVIKGLGDVIFKNLAILYAIGVAFSLSKHEQGWAAFSAAVAYLTMQTTISIILKSKGLTHATTTVDAFVLQGFDRFKAAQLSSLFTSELGNFTYRTGIFGGIIIGVLVSLVHKKFYNTKLPLAMSFFSGTRTVPILSLLLGAVLGGFFSLTWPIIGGGLAGLAYFIHKTGLLGTFIYRTVYESLVPFGLHSILGVSMGWTELGGIMNVDGHKVVGTQAIQLAQLGSPRPDKLLVRSFMGALPIIDFAGFPGAALAIYHTARKENKKLIAGLLIPAMIACIVFGITEPILFTFLFVAPWLYFGVHAPLAGLGAVLSEYFKVSVYQGNLKDWIPFLLRPEKLNLYPYLFIFPLFFLLYYFIFKWAILKFNVQTPGREDNLLDPEDIKLYSKKDYLDKKTKTKKVNETNEKEENKDIEFAKAIIENLGGKDNIEELDNCISRLRIILVDPSLASSDIVWKRELKALGIIRSKKTIQIIYGPQVPGISADVRSLLGY